MANPTFIHGGINTNGDIAVTNAAGSVQYTIDNVSGTNGQVLTLDGSNVASWADIPAVSYNSLTDLPTLFSGSYNDLTDTPTLFSGSYNDLTNLPTLFSGNYNDLTNKPDLTGYALESYVDNSISALIDAAPGALDTLNELAASLGDDADFAGTMTTALAGKAPLVHTHTHDDITDFDVEVTALANTQIGAASIGDLSDVDTTTAAPTNDQVLAWDTDKFVPVNVSALSTADSISSLTDTTTTTYAAGHVLYYKDGTDEWVNDTPANAGLATTADLVNKLEDITGESITDLSDVTNIGSDGDLIVNNGGNLEGASTISHDKISDFDTEAAAIADTQIAAASIDDLSDVGAPSGSNQNGDVLVWDTNQWVPRTASTQVITSDSATSLTDISFDLDGSNKAAIQVDYVMTSATSIRAGIIHAISNGSSYEISDLSTIHAGAESQLPEFSAANAGGGDLGVKVQWANGYTIKYTVQNLLR